MKDGVGLFVQLGDRHESVLLMPPSSLRVGSRLADVGVEPVKQYERL